MADGQDYQAEAGIVEAHPAAVVADERPSGPWGFWATMGFTLVVMVAQMILQGIILGIFAISKLVENPNREFSDIEDELYTGLFLSIATLVTAPLVVGLVYLFARIRRGYPVKDYLCLRMPARRTVIKWHLVLVVYLVIYYSTVTLFDLSSASDFMHRTYETAYFAWLLFFCAIVLAPISEEMLFRGFMIPGIQSSVLGAPGAILLSSLFWAGLHIQYDLYVMMFIFGGGILLGIARIATRSLLLTILMHAFWNTVASIELLIKIHFFT